MRSPATGPATPAGPQDPRGAGSAPCRGLLDVPADEMRTQTVASAARVLGGDIEGGLAGFDAALASTADNPVARLRHDELLSRLLTQLGDHRTAIAVTEASHPIAVAAGLERDRGNRIAVIGARARIAAGDLDGAQAVLHQVHEAHPSPTALGHAAVVEAELRMLRDDIPGAAAALADAVPELAALRERGIDDELTVACMEARVALAHEGPVAAWPAVERGWHGEPRPGASYPLLALAAVVLAELRRAGIEPPESSSLQAEAEILAAIDLIDVWPVAADWRTLIDAELSGPEGLGDDPEAWRRAVAATERGLLPARCRARALRRLAEALRGAGDREAADETAALAAEFANQHGLRRTARLLSTPEHGAAA